jgi:hypothetical protein
MRFPLNSSSSLCSFPFCTHKHVEKQFCGSSLDCSVLLCGALADTPPEHLLVVGEFRTEEQFRAGLRSELLILPRSVFLWDRKTPATMFGRFYEGSRVVDSIGSAGYKRAAAPGSASSSSSSSVCYNYQFNAELAGWNYGWQSNKHKTRDWHVFQISVYVLGAAASAGGGSAASGSTADKDVDKEEEHEEATEEEEHEEGAGAGAGGEGEEEGTFSLVLRTASSPFRILSARR